MLVRLPIELEDFFDSDLRSGDTVEFKSPMGRKTTAIGRITKARFGNLIAKVYKNKEKFVKNLKKRGVARGMKILSERGHPLTSIFK